jgi:hypothetical protein
MWHHISEEQTPSNRFFKTSYSELAVNSKINQLISYDISRSSISRSGEETLFLLLFLSKTLSIPDRQYSSVSIERVTSSEVKQLNLVCSKGDSLVIGPGGIKLHLPLML